MSCDNSQNMQTDSSPAHNNGLALWHGDVRTFKCCFSLITSVQADSLMLRKVPQRQPAKRYAQCYDDQQSRQ